MSELTVSRVPVEELRPDPANARTHPPENLRAIRSSLSRFGQQRPLVVRPDGTIIAGNGTYQAARELGWTEVAVVEFAGTDEEARAFAIADNRTAELAAWNAELLAEHLEELAAVGWELEELGFDDFPLASEFGDLPNAYTRERNLPRYEVVGERPRIDELYDESKTRELRERIEAADLEPELRAYLLAAAARHTRFNYRKAAEFYPHAEREVQELMEESALIIIDLDDAIQRGFVRFTEVLAELRTAEG